MERRPRQQVPRTRTAVRHVVGAWGHAALQEKKDPLGHVMSRSGREDLIVDYREWLASLRPGDHVVDEVAALAGAARVPE
jgi:hypothetical protein